MIKIIYAKVPPKNITIIQFHKDKEIKFVEKGKSSELYIKAPKDIDRRKLIVLIRKAIRVAKEQKLKKIAFNFFALKALIPKKITDEEFASIFGQNIEMANFEFTEFRTRPKEGWPSITEITIIGSVSAKTKTSLKRGQTIGIYVNHCRRISNTPGGDMTPKTMVSEAKKLAKDAKIKMTILGRKELKKLKAGAILGVAQGSKEEPQFIVMEYKGGSVKEKPIVLVGKGVTFDTGGINIKTGDSALGMHMDMSGGAAVICAIVLASKLKIKKNVVALVPAVENMPGGAAYRPGDVLRSMSGKTIEVRNTDAEGRVILADALTYARKYKPRLVVDVATLTVSALSALGERANAIMTKSKKLQDLFVRLGDESGAYMWPLPLWAEYEEEVKGIRGDVTNTNNKNSRYGGAINGGIFLHEFAKGMPWVHIDMAPRMESIPSDNLAPGAAGEPVRFLLKLVEAF